MVSHRRCRLCCADGAPRGSARQAQPQPRFGAGAAAEALASCCTCWARECEEAWKAARQRTASVHRDGACLGAPLGAPSCNASADPSFLGSSFFFFNFYLAFAWFWNTQLLKMAVGRAWQRCGSVGSSARGPRACGTACTARQGAQPKRARGLASALPAGSGR